MFIQIARRFWKTEDKYDHELRDISSLSTVAMESSGCPGVEHSRKGEKALNESCGLHLVAPKAGQKILLTKAKIIWQAIGSLHAILPVV